MRFAFAGGAVAGHHRGLPPPEDRQPAFQRPSRAHAAQPHSGASAGQAVAVWVSIPDPSRQAFVPVRGHPVLPADIWRDPKGSYREDGSHGRCRPAGDGPRRGAKGGHRAAACQVVEPGDRERDGEQVRALPDCSCSIGRTHQINTGWHDAHPLKPMGVSARSDCGIGKSLRWVKRKRSHAHPCRWTDGVFRSMLTRHRSIGRLPLPKEWG